MRKIFKRTLSTRKADTRAVDFGRRALHKGRYAGGHCGRAVLRAGAVGFALCHLRRKFKLHSVFVRRKGLSRRLARGQKNIFVKQSKNHFS